MAALLKIAPVHGASAAAETIGRLNRALEASLCRQAQARPTLACRWQQDAHGRLSCYWEIDLPDIPVPPH